MTDSMGQGGYGGQVPPQQTGQFPPQQTGQLPPQGNPPFGGGPGGPGGPGSPTPEPQKPKRRTGVIIAAIVAVLALVAGGVLLSGVLDGDDDETAASTEGEIFLAAAEEPGPDAFSTTSFAAPADPAPAPVAATPTSVTAPSGTQLTATAAATPGLYGGTQNQAACDPTAMVDFLAANPDKAAAWVQAMNEDPTVTLPDGSPLTVATIPQYVATLTPVVLAADTRVTNHGYKAGKPTTLQSVLQKGTAVMVDNKGVPRVKCACGNPLRGPVATQAKPVYTGKVWPDFNPVNISVVQNSTTVINVFVLKDLKTGTLFDRPAGSNGTRDVPNTTATTTTTTTAPSQTTTPGSSTTVPPSTSSPTPSYVGTYAGATTNTNCQANGGTCPATGSFDVTFTSCTATECSTGRGNVFTLSGNTLTNDRPADSATAWTCDGRELPTRIVTTLTMSADGSTATGTQQLLADAAPPSCPQPFVSEFSMDLQRS